MTAWKKRNEETADSEARGDDHALDPIRDNIFALVGDYGMKRMLVPMVLGIIFGMTVGFYTGILYELMITG